MGKYSPPLDSPTCTPLPPLARGVEDLMQWLSDNMPRDSERGSVVIMRMGGMLAQVLGASLDLLCELRAERDRLKEIK